MFSLLLRRFLIGTPHSSRDLKSLGLVGKWAVVIALCVDERQKLGRGGMMREVAR